MDTNLSDVFDLNSETRNSMECYQAMDAPTNDRPDRIDRI